METARKSNVNEWVKKPVHAPRRGRHLRPARWAVALAALIAPLAPPATVLAQERAQQIRIAAQPLGDALMALGEQTGLQIFFAPDIVRGRQAPAVAGDLAAEQALQQLLRGSGIRYERDGRNVTLSRPAGDGAAAQLAPLTIVGQADSATGPLAGYLARRSATATKTDTPLIETPQAISIVGAQQMRDQRAQSLQDALGYSAGVMTGIVAKSAAFEDTMSIRGFEANPQTGSHFRDGMRYMANQYNGKQEPYGLERVEVLKGPSSILYGAAAPGGVINTISKRPTAETLRELNVSYGSFDHKTLSGDFGGKLDEAGVWSYRLTGLVRDADSYVDYGRDDRTYLAPALTWRPSAATSLTLLATYQRNQSFYPPGLPASGSLRHNVNGDLPRDRFLGEPSHNRYDAQSRSLGYLFEHDFSDSLTLRHGLRLYQGDLTLRYVLLSGDVDSATQRRVSRSARGFDDQTRILTSDTNLQKRFAFGAVTHTVLAGFDTVRSSYDSDRFRGNLPAIDAYQPVYATTPVVTQPWQQRRNSENRYGIYLQDQIKFGQKWVLLAGGRYDHAEADNEALHAPASNSSDRDSAFTGRAGLVYLADNGLAPYVSYSQSFEPTTGRDRNDGRFDPSEGEQFEIGLRYQPANGDTLLSASLFNLTRRHVLTPDPVDPGFLVQTGKVRSRGLELEAKTRLNKSVDVIAAYTYTDARVKASNIPGEVGERFNSPRHMFSLWADARLDAWDLDGWLLGAGLRYVSARPDRPATGTLGGGAYTLVDARLAYETGPWTYALNANNLTDRRYIPSMCYSGICDFGEPRRVVATVSYRW